jgi:hypothetical protein
MPRLYSDLADGSGRRYYFGLESAPGGLVTGNGLIVITGLAPNIFEQVQVFRTPATAALTFSGALPKAQPYLIPATAALAYGGLVPGLEKFVTITNAIEPVYGSFQDTLPSVQTIMLLTPAQAQLAFLSLQPNVTQGGNIGFIFPGAGLVTIQGLGPNFPKDAGLGLLSLIGLAPTLGVELTITPDTGALTFNTLDVALGVPFTWVDDDRAATPVWIDMPAA